MYSNECNSLQPEKVAEVAGKKNEYGSDDNKKGGEKPLFFVFPAMATSEF